VMIDCRRRAGAVLIALASLLPVAGFAGQSGLRADQVGGVLLSAPAMGAQTTDGGRAATDDTARSASRLDPFEGFNRAVFRFNDALDQAALKPVAQTYVDVVAEPWRQAIANAFSNLSDPWSGLNCLLQGKPVEAATQVARFLINTTVGIAGLVDVAGELGLERHREDFGQTLGRWGVGAGPYLVLPLLGPSSLRDGLALVLDQKGDPLRELHSEEARLALQTVRVVDTRASLLRLERLVESAAFDRYTFVRNGYLQRRVNLVYDGNPPETDE
jgi:phospholipid-binding lipoprotein MlaA